MLLLITWFNTEICNTITYYFSDCIDISKRAQLIKDNGNIFKDVMLLVDEIYIQISEEYVVGECFVQEKTVSYTEESLVYDRWS